MLETKSLTVKLTKKHMTRNPFKIAEEKGCLIVFCPLVGVRGFCQRVFHNTIIYISDELNESEQNFVCAHELGHIYLHAGYNRTFLDTRTQFVTSRFETEANRFAVDLLFDDEELPEYNIYTRSQIASILGVSNELAEYRMSTVEPTLY